MFFVTIATYRVFENETQKSTLMITDIVYLCYGVSLIITCRSIRPLQLTMCKGHVYYSFRLQSTRVIWSPADSYISYTKNKTI
jgi:hypothetical protein